MLLAFSDKILYVIGYALGRQISFKILFNSIVGNTPFLCGYAKCIIYAEAGYPGDLLKIIFY
jgi:hypothetical protein